MPDINDLLMACHGDYNRVREIVEAQPELVNQAGAAPFAGETPLGAASHMGQIDIAEYLLSRGAPLDIYAAAMLGRTVEVEQFLDAEPSLARGGNPRAHGIPALHFPIVGNHIDILQLMVARGADVNAMGVLHAAVGYGRPEMARWLIEQGADVNGANWDGTRPLHYAASFGQADLCQLLLDHGADPNATTQQGQTPLALAEEKGHTQAAEVLRQYTRD